MDERESSGEEFASVNETAVAQVPTGKRQNCGSPIFPDQRIKSWKSYGKKNIFRNTQDVTSDDEYISREYTIKEVKLPVRIARNLDKYGQSSKRTINESETVYYSCPIVKQRIKREDSITSNSSVFAVNYGDGIPIKKDEPIECPSELRTAIDYNDGSDASVEKFDTCAEFIFKKDFSPKTENGINRENSTSSDSSVKIIEHDNRILVKNGEPVYSPSEFLYKIEYEAGSDVSIEKFQTTDLIFKKVPSPKRKNDIKRENSTSSDSSVMTFEYENEILTKKDDPVDGPSKYRSEIEYEERSDVAIDKFDTTDLMFEQTPSAKTSENDIKPSIMSLKDWLQLSPDEYVRECAKIVNLKQFESNLTDDEDPDAQSSSYADQLAVQQPHNSQITNNCRAANPFDQCENRHKRSLDLPKVKPLGVKTWRESTIGERTRVQKLKRTKNNCQMSRQTPDNRRVTRSLIKSIENISPNNNWQRDDIGKFVWGYCMGWWPALIVAAEDGGLEPIPDKVCVYWIGEDLISLLNEKTQVEPFSNNLDTRLLKYLREDETGKSRRKAIFVTLKLFSKHLRIPLLKPYKKWAEKHLVGKPHLNDLKFHPFPKNMQQRLDQLKKQNIKAAEKLAQDQEHAARSLKDPPSANDQDGGNSLDKKPRENGSHGKFPKDFVRKSTNELLLNSQEEQHILPLRDQKPGVIVWGKLAGHSWWPAMIIHDHDCGKKEPNFGCQWILWYGDYQLSQVHHLNIMKFEEGIKKMREFITQCRRDKYMKAVLSACKDHCERLKHDTRTWTMDDVLTWVSTLDIASQVSAIPRRGDDGRLESRYSIHIAEKLKEMKSDQEIAAERENRIENCDALKAVFAGLPDVLKVLCIVCLKIRYDMLDHPFFKCHICAECVEEFKATIFAYGEDGKCFYCTLCAGSETVVMCDSCDCPQVYCTACLKYLICPDEYENILMKDPWLCFLCDNAQFTTTNNIFKPRTDWKIRIGQMFHTNQETSWNEAWNNNGKKKEMRVLSLFDGISTGLVVLDRLGIMVENYYASEIDADAEIVSTAYFGDRICRLGDVRNITKETIQDIAPIDLLIGGSPCNDLSIVNPNRLGLHDPAGTGILFFDYCRIKKLVMEANEGLHLFWLFENVASMSSKDRIAINESLQCEPSLIDATAFSPQHRPRLFWGNLPSGVNFPPSDPSQDLQSVLTPNCNRHALVKKIRTVTTKVNSLKQGVSLLKPVLMNGVADALWITELEDIFGFPKHYTDVKNLSATKRQKLIGQAWSVQTISALLLPLRYFFLTKNASET